MRKCFLLSNNGQSPLKVVLSQGAMSPLHMSVEIHIDTMFVSLRLLYQCFQSTNNAEQCRANAPKRKYDETPVYVVY